MDEEIKKKERKKEKEKREPVNVTDMAENMLPPLTIVT